MKFIKQLYDIGDHIQEARNPARSGLITSVQREPTEIYYRVKLDGSGLITAMIQEQVEPFKDNYLNG